MSLKFKQTAAIVAVILWIGMMTTVGLAAAWSVGRYYAAVPFILFMLITGGFLIGLVSAKENFR